MPHTGVAQVGQGATFTVNSVVFDLVESLDFSGFEVAALDSTALSDTWKKFTPSIPDGGSITMTLFYDPSDTKHSGVYDLIAVPAAKAFIVTYKDASTLTGTGFFTKFQPTGITAADLVKVNAEFKVSGSVAYVAGLSS